MKNFPLTLLFLLVACLVSAQDFSDPGAYNNYITDRQYLVEGKLTECTLHSIHDENREQAAVCMKEYADLLRQTVKDIESMPPLNGDADLHDKAADYFRVRLETATSDYTGQLEKAIDSLSFQAIQTYLELQAAQHSKLEKAHAVFSVAQSDFAQKQGYKLTMSDTAQALENKIKVVNRVTDYHNRVHFNCLKILRALGHFEEAMTASEGQRAEFWRSRLEADCREAQARLEQIPPYLGDGALLEKAHKYLRCQSALAEQDFQAITLFLIKFNATEPASQEEVNAYNAAAEGFNAAIAKINATLLPLANELQAESDAFLKRHTPTK